jgi:hypothetical protein
MDVDDRPIGMNGRDRAEPNPRAGGRAPWAEIPAQAQVAAWARGGARRRTTGLLGRAPAEQAGPREQRKGLRAKLLKEMNFRFFSRSNIYMNSMNI